MDLPWFSQDLPSTYGWKWENYGSRVDILTWTQWMIEFWLGPTFFGTGTTYIKNSKGSGWASVLLGGFNSSLATTWPKNDTPAPRQVCGFGKFKSTFGHFVIEFQNLVIVAETSSDRDEQICGSARCISMIVALTVNSVNSRCWMLVSVAGNHVKPSFWLLAQSRLRVKCSSPHI